jgi:cytochrome c oxidase cbb3-type subunit III
MTDELRPDASGAPASEASEGGAGTERPLAAEGRASMDPRDDLLLEHEYDGIREYDNPLPRWWTWIFWATFVFSIGYLFHYHLTGRGQSVTDEYLADMREAREQEARRAMGDKPSEEGLTKLAANRSMMDDAKALYGERCAACHGDRAQGLIGPNLTDGYWIHGKGSMMDIFEVVAGGIPAKGMPAWSRQLSPIELQKLVAFVGSVKGTNVPGKAPEGSAQN